MQNVTDLKRYDWRSIFNEKYPVTAVTVGNVYTAEDKIELIRRVSAYTDALETVSVSPDKALDYLQTNTCMDTGHIAKLGILDIVNVFGVPGLNFSSELSSTKLLNNVYIPAQLKVPSPRSFESDILMLPKDVLAISPEGVKEFLQSSPKNVPVLRIYVLIDGVSTEEVNSIQRHIYSLEYVAQECVDSIFLSISCISGCVNAKDLFLEEAYPVFGRGRSAWTASLYMFPIFNAGEGIWWLLEKRKEKAKLAKVNMLQKHLPFLADENFLIKGKDWLRMLTIFHIYTTEDENAYANLTIDQITKDVRKLTDPKEIVEDVLEKLNEVKYHVLLERLTK